MGLMGEGRVVCGDPFNRYTRGSLGRRNTGEAGVYVYIDVFIQSFQIPFRRDSDRLIMIPFEDGKLVVSPWNLSSQMCCL